jgi:hypothetical protein
MKRLYIAGPYSANNVISVLDNIREGQRAGTEALLAGFAPFVPWWDYHFQLMLREGENLTKEDYYNYSLAWLQASDGMWLLDGWENSPGTLTEVSCAEEWSIPVYYSLHEAVSGLLGERGDENRDRG